MGWGDSDVRKAMAGVKVTSFELDADHEGAWLDGERDGQPVRYRFTVDADCCSSTWIESVLGKSALIGHTIASVDDLDLPGPANSNEHTSIDGMYEDEMSFYGLSITTEFGKCVIDYRNSSNGYYGGSMNIAEVKAVAQ